MKKIYRTGIDAEVFFESASKQASTESSDNGQISLKSTRKGIFKAFHKRVASTFMKTIKTWMKTLIRPIYIRLRDNLSESIKEKLKSEIQSATNKIISEIHSTRNTLQRVETYTQISARRVAVSCAEGEILVQSSVGYVLCSSHDHALLACLVDSGDLEAGTRKLIENFIRPGDVFVDVGANIGLHTLAAAKQMRAQGKVYAFEPFPPTADLLRKSVWLNGLTDHVKVFTSALSSEAGCQRLYLGQTSGHHSLYAFNEDAGSTEECVEVDVSILDEVIPKSEKVDLLKIDAEGAELEVIAGAVQVLEINPDIALIVEFGPSHLRRVGVDVDEWFAHFTRLGMDFRVIESLSGELQLFSVDQLRDVASVNLFFSKPDSKAWQRLID